MTGIAILGSTGSIGRQTLDVVRALPGRFSVNVLAAGFQHEVFEQQIAEFHPRIALAADNGKRPDPEALKAAISHPSVDLVVIATSGHDAIRATLTALELGKDVALANKEAIVCAGDLIMPLAGGVGSRLRPIDSEHSAIWQSMASGTHQEIRQLILTSSGGPFRSFQPSELASVTVDQALKHPNWSMGGKITIDSATMMNKGLEIIEAHWLFGISYGNIQVVIHPEQIVHSIVEFRDASMIAQMSLPDMRLPIQYALTWPERVNTPCARLDVAHIGALHFTEPSAELYPSLGLARQAGAAGGTVPTALSAADDVAVDAFRQGRIGFTDIARVVHATLDQHQRRYVVSLEIVQDADRQSRHDAARIVEAISERV